MSKLLKNIEEICKIGLENMSNLGNFTPILTRFFAFSKADPLLRTFQHNQDPVLELSRPKKGPS